MDHSQIRSYPFPRLSLSFSSTRSCTQSFVPTRIRQSEASERAEMQRILATIFGSDVRLFDFDGLLVSSRLSSRDCIVRARELDENDGRGHVDQLAA